MAVRIFWDNSEKTILRQVYEGVFSLQDYYAAINESAALTDGINYPVDVIVEFEDVLSAPDAPYLLQLAYDPIGEVRSRGTHKYRLASSLEEAYATITRCRQAS